MERLVLLLPPDYPPPAPRSAPRQETKGGFRPAINKERSIFKLHDLMPPQLRTPLPPSVRRRKFS